VPPAGPAAAGHTGHLVLRALPIGRGSARFTCGGPLASVTPHERTEAAVPREHELISAILDTIASLVVVLDPEGKVVWVNVAYERTTGCSASELAGRPMRELMLSDEEEAPVGAGAPVRQRGTGRFPGSRHTRWRTRDGSLRVIEWTSTPIADDRGAVRLVVATGNDVTEIVRARDALRRRDENFRLAEDAARMGSWDWDLLTDELVWSDRCKALFGLPPETRMTYDVFKGTILPDDRDRVEAAVRAALTGKGEYDTEMRVLLPGGGVRWIASMGRAFFDARGVAVRMAGMAFDITERKRREANQALLAEIAGDFARLSREEDITRAIGARLAEHLDISTCSVADFGGGFAHVRSAFTRQGTVEAATSTLRVSDYLNEELQAAASLGQTVVIRDMRTDPRVDATRYEALGVRAGVIVPLLAGGEWRHSFAVGTSEARDWRADEVQLLQEVASHFFARIERARAEEALARANEGLRDADRRKTEFLGILSHELRNPLAPIRNAIFLVERLPPDSPQAARAREVLRRQTEHLTRLVDDLLDVTRISRGKVQLHREVVDLGALVRKTCEDHRSMLAGSDLALVLDLPGSPVWAEVDPTRIAQVLGNLLLNADKFTPAHGAVTVSVHAHDGRAEISVRDTGVGMEPEQVAHLFEPFAQEDRSLARTRGGLGLGLALSRALMELHGGVIVGRSDGPGKGSEFTISLPLASPTTWQAAPLAH
jgi:PAS domain S-box-containing protein